MFDHAERSCRQAPNWLFGWRIVQMLLHEGQARIFTRSGVDISRAPSGMIAGAKP